MTYNLEWLKKNYGSFFSTFGISAEELTAHFEEWQAQSGERSVKDYLWYLFHVLIGETKKQVINQGDLYRNMHEIYMRML